MCRDVTNLSYKKGNDSVQKRINEKEKVVVKNSINKIIDMMDANAA